MIAKAALDQSLKLAMAAGTLWLIGQLPCMADWRAGAARVDITPTQPVRLGGYGNRTSEHAGVEMPIHAKALALTWDQEAPVMILTVDNCAVPATLRGEVLNRINKAGWELSDSRFSLHSSHTHCAPTLPGELPFIFGRELSIEEQLHIQSYAETLTAKLTEVVIHALNDQQPAKLDWSIGKVKFAMNRRFKTETGISNKRNFSGTVDHALPVLRVSGPDGKLRVIYSSYACHCTTLAINKIHPDWAGCFQKELELRFPGVIAMTAIGCGADQKPFPRRELSHAMLHGVALAKEAVRLINLPMKPVTGPVSCAMKEVRLPYDTLPDVPAWHQRKLDQNRKIAMHASYYLRQAEMEKIPRALPYKVQVWAFGDSLLTINLPGEVVVDYGLRFKEENDPARTWVNAYTNDVPCYIPSQRVWDEGGYDADESMIAYGHPTRFASGIEEIIARAVAELVPGGYKKKR